MIETRCLLKHRKRWTHPDDPAHEEGPPERDDFSGELDDDGLWPPDRDVP